MQRINFPVYCNELEEIYPFPSRQAAYVWLAERGLTNDGMTLLVPFQNENKKIRFLKPKNKLPILNEKLRVIGMNNHELEKARFHKFIEKVEESLGISKCHVPHLNKLEGDTIVPTEPHGYLIVYEKGEKDVGEFFYTIFNKLGLDLTKRARRSDVNDPELQINAKALMDYLSDLVVGKLSDKSVECDIKSGRIYFLVDHHLYRYTFKKNPANEREEAYLNAEAQAKQAERIMAYAKKNRNHHCMAAIIGYLRVMILAIPLAIIPGAIVFGFFSLAGLPLMVVAVAAAVTGAFIAFWMINKGFNEVKTQTQDTVEYGKTTFKHLSSSIFNGLKKDVKFIAGFFSMKARNTELGQERREREEPLVSENGFIHPLSDRLESKVAPLPCEVSPDLHPLPEIIETAIPTVITKNVGLYKGFFAFFRQEASEVGTAVKTIQSEKVAFGN